MRPAVLIIAISARPYVQAAVEAGYQVTAIDAFADAQTLRLAEQVLVVEYKDDGFVAAQLEAALAQLDLSQFEGCMYGSGFEAQPALLAKLAAQMPLLGNVPETVAQVKDPRRFFATLTALEIAYPQVQYTRPANTAQYLHKAVGASGGAHIRPADDVPMQAHGGYYQQYVEGEPISLLFVANGTAIEVIGFNVQWVDSLESAPYRYGGAASHLALADTIKQELGHIAERITQAFGLLGVNSLDVVVQGQQIYVLEINPRLSATVGLYPNANIVKRHIAACVQRQWLADAPLVETQSYAHAVVYAKADCTLLATNPWPSWLVDTPVLNDKEIQRIPKGMPVCSVLAQADSAIEAQVLAKSRVAWVQQELLVAL